MSRRVPRPAPADNAPPRKPDPFDTGLGVRSETELERLRREVAAAEARQADAEEAATLRRRLTELETAVQPAGKRTSPAADTDESLPTSEATPENVLARRQELEAAGEPHSYGRLAREFYVSKTTIRRRLGRL